MPRPILKEPPKGSRLAAYVADLTKDEPSDGILYDQSGTLLWRSDDAALETIGISALLSTEHRLWKLPRDFVREQLVLPAIANTEGSEAVRALKTHAPKMLDEFVDLVCDAACRGATSRQRQPREPDNSLLVLAVVWAAVWDAYETSRSLNGNITLAGMRLGLDRHAVRRYAAKVTRLVQAMGELELSAFTAATLFVRQRMASLDRRTSAPSPASPVLRRPY